MVGKRFEGRGPNRTKAGCAPRRTLMAGDLRVPAGSRLFSDKAVT